MRGCLRVVVVIALIAAVHLAVSGGLMLGCFMGVYEQRHPIPWGTELCRVAMVLAFPVTTSVDIISPRYGYLRPAMLNSLLWAPPLYGALWLAQRIRRRQT